MRTTTQRLATVPILLAETYDDARKRGLVRALSTVLVEGLEAELRAAGVEPPPRPEASPQTAAATAARWAPKPARRKPSSARR